MRTPKYFVFSLLVWFAPTVYAADSYRWLHVTIDTPWAIFIFLLPMVLAPAVLMAILYWRVAAKRAAEAKKGGIDLDSSTKEERS